MKEDDLIVSKTDLSGRITYGNSIFIKMSGYSEQELLKAPHNLLRHEDMPKVVFKLLWDRIKSNQPINAYVKNKTKSSDYYWVFANATASLDSKGNIIGYYSVRRKPTQKGKDAIELLYKELLEIENRDGVKEAEKSLMQKLDNLGTTYDEFILSLQK